MRVRIPILMSVLLMGGLGAEGTLLAQPIPVPKKLDIMITPNKLSKAHQRDDISDNCTKCHDYTWDLPNGKCLDCHQAIGRRMENKIGYHGTFKEPCRSCHKEHPANSQSIVPLDEKTFEHNRAAFKLQGKHLELKCDKCHTKRVLDHDVLHYTELKFSQCSDCHKDPHQSQLGAKCESCHGLQGWRGKELKFEHDTDTKFALAGSHRQVKCIECHKPRQEQILASAIFRGLDRNCASCHKDPHQGQYNGACATCHTPSAWRGKGLSFDHNRDAKFQLTGSHAKVECAKCHQPRQRQILASAIFRGLDKNCASCHKDPHQDQFGNTCATCHTANSWQGKALLFDHNKDSKYPLTGSHPKVECIKCHKPRPASAALGSAIFRGLKTDCAACHTDPHRGKLDRTCVTCHTPNAWQGKALLFDHNKNSRYRLTGSHAKVECVKCHQPPPGRTALGFAVLKGLKFSNCDACHRDPHKGDYDAAFGPSCIPCHSLAGFPRKEPMFDHNTSTQFLLAGRHAEIKCVSCHNQKLVKAVNTDSLKRYQTRCDACHEDPHATQLGAECKKCHSSTGWTGEQLLFKHNVNARYQLDDTHKNVACKACHRNGRYKPIEPACKTCHTRYYP